jgi:hypothetical protein
MPTAPWLRALDDIDCATEIVPPHWVDDDEIIALGRRYESLLFERFSDGTLLVTPLPGFARRGGVWCEASDVVGQDADEHEPGRAHSGGHSPQT